MSPTPDDYACVEIQRVGELNGKEVFNIEIVTNPSRELLPNYRAIPWDLWHEFQTLKTNYFDMANQIANGIPLKLTVIPENL